MENFIFDAVFSKLKSEEKMHVYIKSIIALTYLDIKEKWYFEIVNLRDNWKRCETMSLWCFYC